MYSMYVCTVCMHVQYAYVCMHVSNVSCVALSLVPEQGSAGPTVRGLRLQLGTQRVHCSAYVKGTDPRHNPPRPPDDKQGPIENHILFGLFKIRHFKQRRIRVDLEVKGFDSATSKGFWVRTPKSVSHLWARCPPYPYLLLNVMSIKK